MFWVTFDLSSAIAFNLDHSKILTSGNGLTPYKTAKLKPSAEDKIYTTLELKYVSESAENILGKVENAS